MELEVGQSRGGKQWSWMSCRDRGASETEGESRGATQRQSVERVQRVTPSNSGRNPAPSESAIGSSSVAAAATDYLHEISPSSSSSLPVSTALKPPTTTTVWWGPDAATGMWAPATGVEVRFNDSVSGSVFHPEQAWFREDVHAA
ncbi:hypothetical protein L7F22_016663 [Adiantum nelumboides]|nr:hypothetical protein [Adiantum nelumboides]